MQLEPISITEIIFRSHLKTLYKKGKLPVKYGIYGEILTPKNVSDEHIICKCHGGSNKLSNIALAAVELNVKRGCKPIEDFVTFGMLRQYLRQFKGVKRQGFDGDSYIRGIRKTFKDIVDG